MEKKPLSCLTTAGNNVAIKCDESFKPILKKATLTAEQNQILLKNGFILVPSKELFPDAGYKDDHITKVVLKWPF